jgi:hypothetical protein
MRRIVLFAVMSLLLIGCHKQQIANGPQFNLDSLPEERVEAPVEVTIEDKRPDWERRYFEGDVTLFPLEQMTPSPIVRLQREIEDRTRELPEPARNVTLDLESFRIVSCTHADLPCLEPVVFGFPKEKVFDCSNCGAHDGYAAVIVLGLYVAIVTAADLGVLGYDAAVTAIRYAHYSGAKPRELLVNYPDGLTCDIRATATLHWPDGRHKKLDLHAIVNRSDLAQEEAATRDRAEDVRLILTAACRAFGQEFRERVLNPDMPGELGPKQPIPVWTAYSGN